MSERTAWCWKTEYVVSRDGEENSWHDDQADALQAARAQSASDPEADVVVTRLRHFATERTEIAVFSDGLEEQEHG